MAKMTIVFGALLTVLGLFAYFVLATGDDRSLTALIPAFFGVPLLVLGVLALQASMRKRAIYVAVLLGVLGVIGAFSRIGLKLFSGDGFEWTRATSVQVTMGLICMVFVVLCVLSFIAARRNAATA